MSIVDSVETRVAAHEDKFGQDRLLDLINRIDPSISDDHTAYYRQIIRGNAWPNVSLEGLDATNFLLSFERSSLAYVDVGFEALRHLDAASETDLPSIHRAVMASEGLRGQFGKSSPDGLDARLARLEDELFTLLRDEALVVLLGTPTGPLQSAESSMLDDFIALNATIPGAIKRPDCSGPTAATCSAVWSFLRRHARWNLTQAARIFEQLATCTHHAQDAMRERTVVASRQAAALVGLPTHVRAIVDGIVALNHLNLTLEPSFGFKGCVGVPHGLIFREAEKRGFSNEPIPAQVDNDKWNLFRRTRCEAT